MGDFHFNATNVTSLCSVETRITLYVYHFGIQISFFLITLSHWSLVPFFYQLLKIEINQLVDTPPLTFYSYTYDKKVPKFFFCYSYGNTGNPTLCIWLIILLGCSWFLASHLKIRNHTLRWEIFSWSLLRCSKRGTTDSNNRNDSVIQRFRVFPVGRKQFLQ